MMVVMAVMVAGLHLSFTLSASLVSCQLKVSFIACAATVSCRISFQADTGATCSFSRSTTR